MKYVNLLMKTFHKDGTTTLKEYAIKYGKDALKRGERLKELLEKRDGNMRVVIFHGQPYETPEAWEYDVSAFCERAGILPDSPLGKSLYALSDERFQEITAVCDPEYDGLIHVDDQGFSVNHGNVGSRGVRYEFSIPTGRVNDLKQRIMTNNHRDLLEAINDGLMAQIDADDDANLIETLVKVEKTLRLSREVIDLSSH